MKRYWDYSEKERSEMEREQVQSLLDVELMEKGVLKVKPLVLREVTRVNPGDAKNLFQIVFKGKYGSETVSEFAFETMEQAKALIDLNPQFTDYDYSVGDKFRYYKPMLEAKIQPVELYPECVIANAKSKLKEAKAIEDENTKAKAEHDKDCREVEKACSGVWDDWNDCRSRASEHHRVIDTLADYTKTAGDTETAMRFLRKVYSDERIQEAHEWFGMECPVLSESEVCVSE